MTEQLDAGLVAEQIAEHPDAMSSPYAGGELGRGRRRKEDAKLVTGQTNWTDNITLPGLLHMAVLRSPMAHAKVLSVDVVGRAGDARGHRRLQRRRPRRRAGRAAVRLAGDPRHGPPGPPAAGDRRGALRR